MTTLSNSLAQADIATALHPSPNARRHEEKGPLVIERGEGVHVVDNTGKRYIEGLAGLWSVGVGFSALVPGAIVRAASPESVLTASGGGAETSAGAAWVAPRAGACAVSIAAAITDTVTRVFCIMTILYRSPACPAG